MMKKVLLGLGVFLIFTMVGCTDVDQSDLALKQSCAKYISQEKQNPAYLWTKFSKTQQSCISYFQTIGDNDNFKFKDEETGEEKIFDQNTYIITTNKTSVDFLKEVQNYRVSLNLIE